MLEAVKLPVAKNTIMISWNKIAGIGPSLAATAQTTLPPPLHFLLKVIFLGLEQTFANSSPPLPHYPSAKPQIGKRKGLSFTAEGHLINSPSDSERSAERDGLEIQHEIPSERWAQIFGTPQYLVKNHNRYVGQVGLVWHDRRVSQICLTSGTCQNVWFLWPISTCIYHGVSFII